MGYTRPEVKPCVMRSACEFPSWNRRSGAPRRFAPPLLFRDGNSLHSSYSRTKSFGFRRCGTIIVLPEFQAEREKSMSILSRSVVTVPATATVMDAIRTMAGAKVGSVVVVDGGRLEGIFSERDVMLRVVLERRDSERTQVREVMTSPVQTISRGATGDDALKVMFQEHIRHLPIIDDKGNVLGIVSMRNLLEEKVRELNQQLDSLESYITADGIGG